MEAAIFDVDGTISHTRNGTSLKWLRSQQQPRLAYAMWVASLAWRVPMAMAVDQVDRAAADRLVYAQYAGLSCRRVAADAQRCCDEILLPLCFDGALAELDTHRKAGRRILLVTGNVDVVMAPFARALGAELLAQRLVAEGDHYTGEYLPYEGLVDDSRMPSQGEAKAQALAAYAARTGIDLRASIGYGDSINDVPMLDSIGTAIAVRPDTGLRRIATERGWAIRQW